MARKHAKKFSRKVEVRETVLKPAVQSKEREVREVPAGTEGAVPITQEDGSTKFFLVTFKVTSPAVVKHIACDSTTTKGKRNTPDNMAPKGKGGSAPITQSKKK